MAIYDSLDLDFTWDGDFALSNDGDLKSNEDDVLRSIETEVRDIVKSHAGDWELHPFIGAGLSDFQGEPNTRETGKEIEDRVRSVISDSGIIRAGDIKVRVVPTSIHEILVVVTIAAFATGINKLKAGELLNISFSYDTTEDSLFFVSIDQKTLSEQG